MSQQENPQDHQADPSAPTTDSWSPAPTTNRPADGAARAASLHQAEQTWKAADGATDFLGLEQDAPAGGAAPAAAPGEGAGAEANPTQAWLFHMENEARAMLPAQQAGAEVPFAGQLADAAPTEELLEGEQPLDPEGSPSEFDPELAEEIALAGAAAPREAAPARSRKRQWLVAASLVAVLLGAGGWQYWNSKAGKGNTSVSDPIAWRGGHKTPKPKPTPASEPPAAEKPPVAQVPKQPEPQATKPAQPEPTPVPVAVAPPPAPEPQAPPQPQSTTSEGPWGQATPKPAGAEPLAQSNPGSEPAAPDFSPIPFAGGGPVDPASGIATPRGARRPGAQELASLWTAQTIPMDAIPADALLLTPRVGAVRLLLKNGEHLQGRLHSVGQDRVCVDLALGRMSLEYAEVSEIVQIMESDLTKKPSNGLPEETAGLLYVSAKVPGGQLTGWLVQRREGKLTLITEQAKRVTFDDEGFEPISKSRARVVGALDPNAAEPTSPAKEPDSSTPKLQSGAPGAKPAAVKPGAKPPPAKAPPAKSPAKPAGAVKPKG
jgi:hypothetical protein